MPWLSVVVVVLIGLPLVILARLVNRIGVVHQAEKIVELGNENRRLFQENKRLRFHLHMEQTLLRKMGGDPLFPLDPPPDIDA